MTAPVEIPVLVRLAGLSARLFISFGEPRLLASLAEIESLRPRLDALRARAVERLYRRLPRAGAEERRLLLALKRDCHNRRPVARYRRHRLWPLAVAATGGVLLRIVTLETGVEEREEVFRRTYAGVRERERRALLEPAAGPWLRRGLALASPDLVEGLERHRARPSGGHKARRLELSLLRYLSRAALKLSPYSTLTALALADLHSADGGEAIRYVPGPRRERSLVRVKRSLLDPCCRLLFRHPQVRDRLLVGLNPSLERLESGEVRLLRPPQLCPSAADHRGARLEKVPPAQVKARLGGDLVRFVSGALDGAEMPFGALVEAAVARLGDGAPDAAVRFAHGLEQLLDLGFLELRPPWPGYEPTLEARLLQFLATLPAASVPETVTATLRELVDLEAGFASAVDPAVAVRRIDAAAIALYDAFAGAIEPLGQRPLSRAGSRSFYEDVFLAPRDPDSPCLLQLDRGPLRRALAAGDLVWRLGYLFEPRHEALLALEHHLATHHADRSQVPVGQLFAETSRLWSGYRRHVDRRLPGPFDPHRLCAVAELEVLRAAVRRRLAESVQVEGDAERLPVDALRSLIEGVPRRFLPAAGCCLFLQPCDPSGGTWVANRHFEGTGRMSCRFNVVLDPASRELYVDHYAARSVLDYGGDRVELVDMLFTKGSTVNVHWPQTRRVLQMPGETVDLPPRRVLRFADLSVERHAGRAPRLTAPGGEWIVPCFLSPLDVVFMPTVLRFLDLFGVHAHRSLPAAAAAAAGDGCTEFRRRVVDNLVIGRRHWIVDPATLPAFEAGAAGFLEVARWRRRLGLPVQVYLLEREPAEVGGGDAWKPQYLDFRSPSFVDLFAAAIDRARPTMTLIEALPRPQDFPIDPEEGPRACEVMLEALALAPLAP